MWVLRVYIVWMKIGCCKYAKIAKQNILRAFCEKALLANYSRKTIVMTLRIPVMCSTRGSLREKTSRETSCEIHLVFNKSLSILTLSHTQPIQ